jgi:hypothetical protein
MLGVTVDMVTEIIPDAVQNTPLFGLITLKIILSIESISRDMQENTTYSVMDPIIVSGNRGEEVTGCSQMSTCIRW